VISRIMVINIVIFAVIAVFFLAVIQIKTQNVVIEESPYYKTEKIFPFSSNDLMCLAKNIYHEAGIESDLGKYAVAQVTVNRIEHGSWPDSVCSVVYQYAQFSWTLDPRIKHSVPKATNANWHRSIQIAFDVLYNGTRIRALEDVYFFHADYVTPRWSRQKELVTKIDTHIFYKFREVTVD